LKISLIISTYNWPEALRASLASVLMQTQLPDEVIIADDGSTSETKNLIESLKLEFPIPLMHAWHEDKGFRLSSSRNNAIRKANYDYIIIIDGDLLLHKDFILDHTNSSEKGFYIQGSRVFLNKSLSSQLISESSKSMPNIFSSGLSNRKHLFRSRLLMGISAAFSKQSHRGTRGCNLAAYKNDLYSVNGFNEEFTSWGREDSEFTARLLHSGIKRKNLKFGGIAFHLWHETSKAKASTENEKILELTLTKKLIRCDHGLINIE